MSKRKQTCRLALNFSDFEEKNYMFVPYTFDLESMDFIDHWEKSAEGSNVPDGWRCMGFIGDDMYSDKAIEIVEAGEIDVGVKLAQNDSGELEIVQ